MAPRTLRDPPRLSLACGVEQVLGGRGVRGGRQPSHTLKPLGSALLGGVGEQLELLRLPWEGDTLTALGVFEGFHLRRLSSMKSINPCI